MFYVRELFNAASPTLRYLRVYQRNQGLKEANAHPSIFLTLKPQQTLTLDDLIREMSECAAALDKELLVSQRDAARSNILDLLRAINAFIDCGSTAAGSFGEKGMFTVNECDFVDSEPLWTFVVEVLSSGVPGSIKYVLSPCAIN